MRKLRRNTDDEKRKHKDDGDDHQKFVEHGLRVAEHTGKSGEKITHRTAWIFSFCLGSGRAEVPPNFPVIRILIRDNRDRAIKNAVIVRVAGVERDWL